jgi:hypothetical protein
MKRFAAIVSLSTLLCIAAFVVLVIADRQLGLPLPYSIPISFAVVSMAAPAAFAVANAIRLRRPVIIATGPTPRRAHETAMACRHAEGVVLLDLSKRDTLQERAA